MKKLTTVISLALGLSGLAQADSIEAGKQAYEAAGCAACHQADGNSVAPTFPKLAGQHASYLSKQLHDLQQGQQTQGKEGRYDPVMSAQAILLNDQQIEQVVAYLASQTVTVGKTPEEFVTLGEKLYRAGDAERGVPACLACHGPRGNGNEPAKFPKLSGQLAEYTVKQLQDFKSGKRSNSINNMMTDIAGKMTEEEMKAVAYYILSLH